LWISSLRDSRVSPSAWSAEDSASKTNGGSGRISRELLARFDQDGSWERTSPDLLTETGDSLRFSGRFPLLGMMLSGDVFGLTKSVQATGERGSSYLRNWPTPTARDYKDAAGNLSDRKDGKSRMDRVGVVVARSLHPSQKKSVCGENCSQDHRRLNPAFVEFLMGLPKGWTLAKIGSGPAETEWSRYKQRLQSALSQLMRDGNSPESKGES